MPLTMPKKTCSCCGESKPLSEFYLQSYTQTPSNQCKTCINVKRSVERNKAKHGKFVSKEKIRAMEVIEYELCDWRDAMLYFSGGCCYCGVKEGRAKSDKFDREHLVPLSRGGKAVKVNIVPACRKCNRGRGNKKLFEWFRAQPFYRVEMEEKIVQWMGITAAEAEGYIKTN